MARSSAAPGGYIGGEPPRKPYFNQLSGVWKIDDAMERKKNNAWSDALGIEDLFSTHLYTGNGSTQTITNGIDLSGKGGLVWIKSRSLGTSHVLTDTARGSSSQLYSDRTNAQGTVSDQVTAFTGSGFSLGTDSLGTGTVNSNTNTYCSWTFRKAPKFFDIVTYTGNGSARTIAHNLGSVPGCIIVKSTSQSDNWKVYHRSLTSNAYYLLLDSSAAQSNGVDHWNSTTPTATQFSIGSTGNINTNGATYVAYLFAHDAGGFGDSGNDSVVKCGSYTGNGSSTGPVVDLGWEPQWLLVKNTSSSGDDWILVDNMRGFPVIGNTTYLNPNNAFGDSNFSLVSPLATGFQPRTTDAGYNGSGLTYIYIAIRRGSMKAPVDATKVFKANTYTGNGSLLSITGAGFPPDFSFTTRRDSASWVVTDRLRGAPLSLYAQSTDVETNNTIYEVRSYNQDGVTYGQNSIVNGSSSPHVNYLFRRAPGFFDAVAFKGSSSTFSVPHNLGVVPSLVLIKKRIDASGAGFAGWWVLSSEFSGGYMSGGSTSRLVLNTDAAAGIGVSSVLNSVPTSTVLSLLSSNFNASDSFIAYLFASCPGVSKVGSYVGDGGYLWIDCGFTTGARFILIKRTDSTGDWYVWDHARGIFPSADDPYLRMNSTGAEVTNTDWIYAQNIGFTVNPGSLVNINGASYVYLAIA